MKRANGDGTVYRMKGNRRRPFVARKTAGKNEKGFQTYNWIGYYATRKEALAALENYNRKPYDTRATLQDMYDEWSATDLPDLRQNSVQVYKSAWKHLEPISTMKMAEIRLVDLQAIVTPLGRSVGNSVKTLMSHLFGYAVRHEVITADRFALVSFVKVSQDRGNKVERKVFTEEEIRRVTDPIVKILLYTGLRAGEILNLKAEDIHLDERWLYVRESKTAAGIRVVPIAEKIVDCFDALPCSWTYQKLNYIMDHDYGHRPHDTRHTFISRMANLTPAVDERITKAIVGHAGSGITETVYTHMDLRPLLEAVNRLP